VLPFRNLSDVDEIAFWAEEISARAADVVEGEAGERGGEGEEGYKNEGWVVAVDRFSA
jgi:hypothetical protein